MTEANDNRNDVTRRAFLSRGAAAAAGFGMLGGAAGLLAACGSSAKSASVTPTTPSTVASLGSANLQLFWIKNVQFAGSYIADTKGYYKQQGLTVDLLSGGPSVTTEPVVTSGKALMGITGTDIAASAINQGAPLVIIGCQYQRNPNAITSLASKPIKTPKEMYGKKIGVQAANESIWSAFLKLNNLDPSKIDKVPVQFDPAPLATGEVDGWFSFYTNEPNLLKSRGVDTYVFLLDDFGFHLLYDAYVVRKESLTTPNERAQIVAMIKAERLGWEAEVKNPGEGAELAVTKYGKNLGLKVAEQTLEATAQNKLLQSSATKAKGLFWMSDEDQQRSIATLALSGIKIDQDALFTDEILQEVA
jgi:ABC-type nitrate/sulfonate/bicarbonate transport system substrate-binding protein